MNFLKSIVTLIRNVYGGLPAAVWLLSLIGLINRSGTMVLPFMSVYLCGELNFSIAQAGYIMMAFGIGSTVGTHLSGTLIDRFGAYYVQLGSLLLGGLLFFVVMQLRTLESISLGVFVLSAVSDAFRPANATSVAYYTTPENRTRAYSLNRLAFNLGYAVGPSLGGILASYDYSLLFVADGLTCLLAGIFFAFLFRKMGMRAAKQTEETAENTEKMPIASPYRDRTFVVFLVFSTLFAMSFFQFFTTLPLYWRKEFQIPEENIGLLIACNGFFVFLFEMLIVYKMGDRFRPLRLMSFGTLLVGVSYLLLNVVNGYAWWVFILFSLTMSEILTMPFMNTYVVARSNPQNRGRYIAAYTMVYSLAHILAPTFGTQVAERFGFDMLWVSIFGITLISSAGFRFLK